MLLKLIRALDGILVGLAGLFLLALAPPLVGGIAGNFHVLFILPVLWIAWCTTRLPGAFHQIEDWEALVGRLRLSAIACAWLAPFLIWWRSAPGNLYFYLNAMAAIAAFAWFFYNLSALIQHVARFVGNGGLEMESVMARGMTRYAGLLLIVGVLVSSLTLAWIRNDSLAVSADVLLMQLIPRPALYVPLLPVVLTGTLLARIRRPLEEVFHALTQDRI